MLGGASDQAAQPIRKRADVKRLFAIDDARFVKQKMGGIGPDVIVSAQRGKPGDLFMAAG